MKKQPTYNVVRPARGVDGRPSGMATLFTGVRYDCEKYIDEHQLTVELVDEPNYAIIVSRSNNE